MLESKDSNIPKGYKANFRDGFIMLSRTLTVKLHRLVLIVRQHHTYVNLQW